MKNIKLIFLLFAIARMHFSFAASSEQCPNSPDGCCIKKVFFHQGIISDKLVFYFTSKPKIVSYESEEDDGYRKLKVECLGAGCVDASCFERARFINSVHKKTAKKHQMPYVLRLRLHDGSIGNSKFSIVYDPRLIDIEKNECESISNNPALVVHIIHKDAVKKGLSGSSGRWFNLKEIKKKRKIRVVIDAGHGGADAGAVSPSGLAEKDIVLEVGKCLERVLKEKGFEVYVTRSTDVFVPLDERTALTNLISVADLFISLHANAGYNSSASGLEIYSLDYKQRESSYEKLVSSFAQNAKILAEFLQGYVIEYCKDAYDLKNRKARSAVSQVLLGVECPAVLIEMGYITNLQDEAFLKQKKHQELIAQALAAGIDLYVEAH